jgi:hypothetical protein
VKHGFSCIPKAHDLVVTSGSIIKAGGTGKRIKELEAAPYELNANNLIAYTNRFADVIEKANYRLNNFQNVRRWHLEGETINGDDDDDEDADESTSARITKARVAYDDAISSIFSLACVMELFGEIPSMVAQCSAEFDHLRLEVIDRLDLLKQKLQLNQTSKGADRSINSVIQKYLPEITPAQRTQLTTKFHGSIMAAAKKGHDSFLKHIDPVMPMYRLRKRFHISQTPEGNGDLDDPTYSQAFFGCSDEEYSNDLIIQRCAYVADWKRRTASDPIWFKSMDSYEYWNQYRSRLPALCDVTLWWDNWPTSSVAAERTFGIKRVVDAPQRGAQSWQIFANEIKLRVNQAILEGMLVEQIAVVNQMQGK